MASTLIESSAARITLRRLQHCHTQVDLGAPGPSSAAAEGPGIALTLVTQTLKMP